MSGLYRTLTLSLALVAASAVVPFAHAAPPGPAVLNGQKVLALVGRVPPGVRCNNNIQVAAELSNVYQVPVLLVPQTLAGPGAKAPAVYYGNELLAVDGGEKNGMVSYAEVADVFEIEGVPKNPKAGRLLEIKPKLDELKSAIKDVK